MKRALCLVLLSIALMSGCGSPAAEASMPTAAASPWGEVQRAEATPYVRTQEQLKAAKAEEPEPADEPEFKSYEDFIRELYAVKGSFYFTDWELEMFEALPQDEPYSFVPRADRFYFENAQCEEADYIAFAEQFVEAGCEAKVKMLHNIQDGYENISYLVIVTTTPAHLWGLSEDWPEWVYVEQLYPEVDLRYDIPVWPEE